MVEEHWTCGRGWTGHVKTGHKWEVVHKDGHVLGPVHDTVKDALAAFRTECSLGNVPAIRIKAQCPECGSWEMRKEDRPQHWR